MTYSDWVLVSATVLGPVLAVQAQKWVERSREKRNRKDWVFLTLMATRAATLSGEHVRALNTIDLAFYGSRVLGRNIRSRKDQSVIDAWREYYDHLNSGPRDDAPEAEKIQWLTRR